MRPDAIGPSPLPLDLLPSDPLQPPGDRCEAPSPPAVTAAPTRVDLSPETAPARDASPVAPEPSSLPLESARTESHAMRTALLAALVLKTPDRDPRAALQAAGQQGTAGMRLLEATLHSPGLFLQALGEPSTERAREATRNLAADTLTSATETVLRDQALRHLHALEGSLEELIGELKGAGPRPQLEQLFAKLCELPREERSDLLRSLGLHLGSDWLQGDLAAALFEYPDPHRLQDPQAARERLLETGETVFAGYSLTLADLQETLEDRLENVAEAREYVRDCEHPLLVFRPLARAAAGEMPWVEELHARGRLEHGGQRIEAPREGITGDFLAGLTGRDERLAETLRLAGVVDESQVDLAQHRARFDVTVALASLIAPSPHSGLLSGLRKAAMGPVDGVISRFATVEAQGVGVRFIRPAAEWSVGKSLGNLIGDAGKLPQNLLRKAYEGEGLLDAPLGDLQPPPEIE